MDTNINIENEFIKKKNTYEKNVMKQKIQQFNNQVEYKTKLLNIDSRFRNKIPKNIYSSNNIPIPNNPISTTQGSNIIKIAYPKHNFNINDLIIIQNVVGKSKTLTESLYFFNNFQYLFINYVSHGINTNYINIIENYQINIEILNININNTNIFYGNIPINAVTGIFNIFLPSILNNNTIIPTEILAFLGVQDVTELDNNWLIVQLPYSFVTSENIYYIPNETFKISFLSIGGIPLPWINSDFPIDYKKYQSAKQIINIDDSNIYFESPIDACNTESYGGNNVQIMLITKIIDGFPYANDYRISLNQTFNNVVRLELISTEFPYIDFLIKSSGPNTNNKLYWKNYNDGDNIYVASIHEGNYDLNSLILTISNALNSVPTINYTTENPIYNIFTIDLNTSTQEITIVPYKQNALPNCLSCSQININNITYIQITVYQQDNIVQVNDTIIISGADKIGSIIEANLINSTHTIYKVNIIEQTYTFLLAPLNNITDLAEFSLSGNGGPSIIIKTKTKVSFLFNKSDTLGTILGFKNVGQPNAITPFSTVISNFNDYIQSTYLNVVGNIDKSTEILNLSGNNYYILMYLNDFECIINNFNQPSAFAKILMSGSPGDILFNTFINYPLEFDFPLPYLNELSIRYTYPDGTLVDFRNIDHSFTLRIIEKTMTPHNTNLNSKDSSFYDTFIENKLN